MVIGDIIKVLLNKPKSRYDDKMLEVTRENEGKAVYVVMFKPWTNSGSFICEGKLHFDGMDDLPYISLKFTNPLYKIDADWYVDPSEYPAFLNLSDAENYLIDDRGETRDNIIYLPRPKFS